MPPHLAYGEEGTGDVIPGLSLSSFLWLFLLKLCAAYSYFLAISIVIFVCTLFPEYIVIEGGATLTFDVRLVQHNQMR